MITRACALVNEARAVDPVVVDVAIVPTSARPITISRRTTRILIVASHERYEGKNMFAIDMKASMVVKVEHQGDDPGGRESDVSDPVRR